MARLLELSDEALDDFDRMVNWQTQSGSGTVARRRVRRIRAAIMRLKRNPCLYPACDQPGVRGMPADGGHRVFYTVIPDTGRSSTAGDVTILRIFGPGQFRESL